MARAGTPEGKASCQTDIPPLGWFNWSEPPPRCLKFSSSTRVIPDIGGTGSACYSTCLGWMWATEMADWGWFNTNSVAFQLFVSSLSIQSMPAQTLPVPHTALPWKRGKNQGERQSLYPCLLPGKPTNRCKVKTVKCGESFCFSLFLCMCGWDSIPPSGHSNKDFRILWQSLQCNKR